MSDTPDSTAPQTDSHYQVVARRYRPTTFDQLVGQDHVGQALANAITSGRIGHAYLFTGARGVGKTSSARIFAKALNCSAGLSPTPCNECEICSDIATGEDVDVLEIDGASNRGIDEIRQLRSNASIRPSRARFKIYIIDEVHMLTREAFNALLKTLEEPPEHVKFIFCTTEPTKIPITILSRCQRFDFAGIEAQSIGQRLAEIADAEGVAIEEDAIRLLARRAAGSMRDAQSLLEQLLAFATDTITLESVHSMLGTANEDRLRDMVRFLKDGDAASALAELDEAVRQGTDVGLLTEQLFGYLRDLMIARVGCDGELFLYASPNEAESLRETAEEWGLETILAAMQILEQTLSRMRFSTQSRLIAELAICRLCRLDQLQDLSSLVEALRKGVSEAPSQARTRPPAANRSPAPRPVKKNDLAGPPPSESGKMPESDTSTPPYPVQSSETSSTPRPAQESRPAGAGPTGLPGPAESAPESEAAPPNVPSIPFEPQNAVRIWGAVADATSGMAAAYAKNYESVAIFAPNRLVVTLGAEYTLARSICERPEQLGAFERAAEHITGQKIKVSFQLGEAKARPKEAPVKRVPTAVVKEQRKREISEHPLVKEAGELFRAEPLDVIDPPKKNE